MRAKRMRDGVGLEVEMRDEEGLVEAEEEKLTCSLMLVSGLGLELYL